MTRARIVGTGKYLPERIITNQEMEVLADTTDEWIRQRTGIHQRHVADDGVGTSDLMAEAAKTAMAEAGIGPDQVDAIVACTLSGDYMFPATGSMVQAALGVDNAAAHDINAACSGFLYGLATANAWIQTGMYTNVLVCGGERIGNQVVWKNRDTGVLFGDGAGAVVLQACDDPAYGVLSMYLGSDGKSGDMLKRPKGGSKDPARDEPHDQRFFIQMDGRELFKRAVIKMPEVSQQALDAAGITIKDVALFVPHQANARIIESAAQRMGLEKEKLFVNIDKRANTVAGTIPIALHEAREEGRIKEGDYVLLASFGAGVSWGASVVRW